MKFNKKGQAALEFLTTYGWAFLIILVMIGALAYFGVLNPDRFVPERCKLSGEIECDAFSITEDSWRLSVANNLGDEINITQIRILDPKSGNAVINSSFTTGSQIKIAAFQKADLGNMGHNFSDADAGNIQAGEKKKFNLEITWFKTAYGVSYSRIATGDLIATIS